jgi:hypothetical protein
MILGYPWFARFEPRVRWVAQKLLESPIQISTLNQMTLPKDYQPLGKAHWNATAAPAILEPEDEVYICLTRTS